MDDRGENDHYPWHDIVSSNIVDGVTRSRWHRAFLVARERNLGAFSSCLHRDLLTFCQRGQASRFYAT